MSPQSMLEHMEMALSPERFDAAWPVTGHEVNSQGYDVWYCAPPPYLRGFVAAVGKPGINAARQLLRQGMADGIRSIPWC